MRRLLLTIALSLSLLLAAAIPAHAGYVTHWQYQGWRFHTGRVCVELNTTRDWLRTRTVEAVDDWNTHTNLTTFVRTNCAAYTQKVVIRAANYGRTSWYGRAVPTSYYWGQTPAGNWTWIVRAARVELNLYYPRTQAKWDRIITHETGHAYGLGHSTACTSVMRESWSCWVHESSTADRRSMNQIYAL